MSPANSELVENPGGMDGYAAEQEQQHLNGSSPMPESNSQQQLMDDRRRQSSIHKQASIEVSTFLLFALYLKLEN